MAGNLKSRLDKIESELNRKTNNTLCIGMAFRNLSDGKLYDEFGNLWTRPEYGKNCKRFIILDKPVNSLNEIPGYINEGNY